MDFKITQGNLQQVLIVLKQLPEFDPLLSDPDYYKGKLAKNDRLILVAMINDKPVGCKLGYDKYHDGSFYSWLGGVVPTYRYQGIARALANQQEAWALEHGYNRIRFKTLNRHKAMLAFSIMNGFEIFNVKPKDEIENYRIELVKELK